MFTSVDKLIASNCSNQCFIISPAMDDFFNQDLDRFILSNNKTTDLAHNLPDQTDHPKSELNPCCFQMYVKFYQTSF
jgi:hypothetical protein